MVIRVHNYFMDPENNCPVLIQHFDPDVFKRVNSYRLNDPGFLPCIARTDCRYDAVLDKEAKSGVQEVLTE